MADAAAGVLRALARLAHEQSPDRIAEWRASLTALVANRPTAAVVSLFDAHGVAAIAEPMLRTHASDLLPPEVLADIARSRHTAVLAALADLGETARLCRLFGEAGIPALPYKGGVLAWRAFGDPASRPSEDIDLLIAPASRATAHARLEREGYALQEPLAQARTLHAVDAQLTYVHARKPTPVDLHWRAAPLRVPWSVPFVELWARSRPMDVAQETIRVLSAEDELLLLLLHHARHHWTHLEMVLTTRALLVKHEVDLRSLVDRAALVGGRRASVAGLLAVHDLCGILTPDHLEKLADEATRRLAVAFAERAVRETPSPVRDPVVLRAALERRRDRVRLWVARAFAPTHREGALVSLPVWLLPLYVPIRVGRLIVRALRRNG